MSVARRGLSYYIIMRKISFFVIRIKTIHRYDVATIRNKNS